MSMISKKRNIIVAMIVGGLLFSACSTRKPKVTKCFNGATIAGYFCYQGMNFGLNKSNDYKEGVVDGCVTANGTFKKNYNLSKKSKLYNDGWISGRSRCMHKVEPTPVVKKKPSGINRLRQRTSPNQQPLPRI